MKVRGMVRIFIIISLFLGVMQRMQAQNQPVAEKQPYNILFIAVDDLRRELGCYGQRVHSPHIDRLAAQGLLFTQAYCQEVLCASFRSSLKQ